MNKPLCFRAEDSGTAEAPVIYAAYPNEKPVISGGRPITGWEKNEKGWWQTHLYEVENSNWNFTQLFVNNQRRHRPRLPRRGYFFIAEEVPATEKACGKGYNRFKFNKGELHGDWHNLTDVEVLCFHIWEMSRMRLASVEEKDGIATFTGSTCSTAYYAALFKGNRFMIENVREALEYPGQWYLDRTSGNLTYISMPEENIEHTEVIAPYLKQLLLLQGEVEQCKWVEYICFEGLTFAHSNWVTPQKGYSCPQAEVLLDAAVYAEGMRHCRFINCTITHIGEYAVQFGRDCQHNLLEGCDLIDLGAGGIKLGQTYDADDLYNGKDRQACSNHHIVRDCLICQAGRIHPGGVGIWIGHSGYNRIEHNEITDLYYSGISVGWVWGYQPSQTHHNILKYNHIYNIGQNVLSDMGAFYMLGISPGTIIRGNHIHDVNAFDYGGWGIYFDQGASGIEASENVCYRCNGQGFHQHFGRENLVRNNIFAFGGKSQIERTKLEKHCSFTFKQNIVYWKGRVPLLGDNIIRQEDPSAGIVMECNIYFNCSGLPILFKDETIDQWRLRGCDKHSVIADPLFVDPENGDFNLKPGSPAKKIGFKSIDLSKTGLLTQRSGFAGSQAVPSFPIDLRADKVKDLTNKKFNAAGIEKD
ncbi:MAG: right-handed parallel beta-helix repeat-containing protein [bacterium]|nr:right-handed parallel beta-helix repeat-containing protein [bacterium]